jgi:hypothetical protein
MMFLSTRIWPSIFSTVGLKFLSILYSRRPRNGLLVNQERLIIIDQKIHSYSPRVKEKIAFGNGLRLQIQIEDLRSKWCILGRNSKNNITGRSCDIL